MSVDTGTLALVSLVFTGLGALIHTLFASMSMSRCTDINACCFNCKRDVLTTEELGSVLDATVTPRSTTV